MDLEQDYLIYAIQASLTFIAVSSAYFIDLSRPLTVLALIPSTALFGYTAYVSRDRFRPHSAISLLALVFIPLGGTVAVVAVAVTLINFLTSIFASGDSFKDFYGGTSLPLLFTGLILGGLLFSMSMSDPAIANTIQDEAASIAGSQAEMIIERSNMLQSQKNRQSRVINSTADMTYRITRRTVLTRTGCTSINSSQRCTELAGAFATANNLIESQLKERSAEKISGQSINISERITDLIENTLKGKAFILLVPLITFGLYSIHPVVGILVAIWASIFSYIGSGKTDETTDS